MGNFYVYELIDPRTNLPFYIGKGTKNRAYYHLNTNKHENKYKENVINSLRKQNKEPIVNIIKYFEVEEEAYQLETLLIKLYGRKGYENYGILTNICINNQPLNHKGKSYIDIYGSEEKAKEQIEKRRILQIEYGGYGPNNTPKIQKRKFLNLLQE